MRGRAPPTIQHGRAAAISSANLVGRSHGSYGRRFESSPRYANGLGDSAKAVFLLTLLRTSDFVCRPRRRHALWFRPASSLGVSQRSMRPIKSSRPFRRPQGNRQISGSCHFCQSSSIACVSEHRSWIPSINNIFSFGMRGVDRIRFSRVVSIASHAGLRAWSVSRARRQTTGSSHLMRTRGKPRMAPAMRASLHAVNPAVHPPNEIPRSPTDGQPSSSSQPVSARISATFCAMACAN